MDMAIALILSQDGITNGAIYALLALALVLVFAVTRVIFIQQGEFVAYGALTLAMMQSGALPATVWLLVVMGVLVTALDGAKALKAGQMQRHGEILARRAHGGRAPQVHDQPARPVAVVLQVAAQQFLGHAHALGMGGGRRHGAGIDGIKIAPRRQHVAPPEMGRTRGAGRRTSARRGCRRPPSALRCARRAAA